VTGGRGKRSGSGFISRDNDDPTAEAIFNFMREAEIPRELTIMWNVIPWWNGTRAVTTPELQAGVSSLSELIRLLPNLKAIMLVGQKAARARSYCENNGLTLFTCDHPSPLVRARWPNRWSAIRSEWRKVASLIA
jgi:uracil-DNA glycosylase